MYFKVESRSIQEEVAYFITKPDQYCAVTLSGRRVNIVRSRSYQPPIPGESDFNTYLWVESEGSFFLFSQRFSAGRAGAWFLEREFIPESFEHFFTDFFDELKKELT